MQPTMPCLISPFADELRAIKLVVWDEDMLSMDYLGEVTIPLEVWLDGHQGGVKGAYGFDDPKNKVCWIGCSFGCDI
jgi:hypothetical protein